MLMRTVLYALVFLIVIVGGLAAFSVGVGLLLDLCVPGLDRGDAVVTGSVITLITFLVIRSLVLRDFAPLAVLEEEVEEYDEDAIPDEESGADEPKNRPRKNRRK
jgi:hypothetical protein